MRNKQITQTINDLNNTKIMIKSMKRRREETWMNYIFKTIDKNSGN